MQLYKFVILSITLKESLSFQIISNKSSCLHRTYKKCNPAISTSNRIPQLYSTNEDEQPQELILGKELSDGLQSIASEEGYLAAARQRNEEAKAKLMEQLRKEEEEAEARRRDIEVNGDPNNGGPGDMSSWQGFQNDGFEESDMVDQSGGWGDVQVAGDGQDGGVEENGEEPKLFLFGDEENSSGSGLIL